MPSQQEDGKSKDPLGNYIVLNGVRRELIHHPTAFAAMQSHTAIAKQLAADPEAIVKTLAIDNARVEVQSDDWTKRNDLMEKVRKSNVVAHHIYLIEGTSDEIAITDRIFVTPEKDNPDLLAAIQQRYEMSPEGRKGKAYVFRVTDAATVNPLKVANDILVKFPGIIKSSVPEIFIPIRPDEPDPVRRDAAIAVRLPSPAAVPAPAENDIEGAVAEPAGPPAAPAPAENAIGVVVAAPAGSPVAPAPAENAIGIAVAEPAGPPAAEGLAVAAAVAEASPSIVPTLGTLIQQQPLLAEQWYMSPGIIGDDGPDIKTRASVSAVEAWQSQNAKVGFGNSEVVIAVIDANFDVLAPLPPLVVHPAFKDKKIDEHIFDFVDGDGNLFDLNDADSHGTFVASLAGACNQMLGVAPGCALLPIRLGVSPSIEPDKLLLALQRASDFADVVNCSFQHKPASIDYLAVHPCFLKKVKKMIKSGGRRKKGLVIVVSAGNFDCPTSLSADDNTDGLKPIGATPIPPHQEIHTSYPEIKNVVVVGSTTSLLRKAAYSNWGPELTVTAPSNNLGTLPGRKILTAIRRPGSGPNPATVFNDLEFSLEFGKTSASAPLVAGVVALMISANQNLSARQIIKILKSSADTDKEGLDLTLDAPSGNLQGTFDGKFVGAHSLFFGAGKVNALKAVEQAMNPPPDDPDDDDDDDDDDPC